MTFATKDILRLPEQALELQDTLARHDTGERVKLDRLDGIIAAALGVCGLMTSLWGFHQLGMTLEDTRGLDLWFQGDIYRVTQNMTDADSDHYRTTVHPAASILISPFGIILTKLGMAPYEAARNIILLFSALSLGLMYAALRLLAMPKAVSALFVGVMASSGTFLHWNSVIEQSLPSQITIILALVLLAYGRTKSHIWWILMSAGTLSITITSWMFGLIATLARWPMRPDGEAAPHGKFSLKAFVAYWMKSPVIRISAIALGIIFVLAVVQFFTFNEAGLFFDPRIVKTEAYFVQPVAGAAGRPGWTPWENLQSLYITTQISPAPYLQVMEVSQWVNKEYYIINNQHSGFSHTAPGIAATVAWFAVLALGIWGAIVHQRLRPVAIAVALMIVAEGVLHVLYGELTFLYAPYVLPPLIMLAAFSWFSPHRLKALALAAVVMVCGGINNVGQFTTAVDIAKQTVAGNPPKIDPPY
jgi:hypothetical protein